MKKLSLNLPVNPTDEEKVAAIELILDSFLDKSGKFNLNEFSKCFTTVQKLINDNIPDWQAVVSNNPLYADDELSEKFLNIFASNNPKPTDFADLSHQISFGSEASKVKQFSSVEMRTNIPPVGEEVIIFHPGYQCCVQGLIKEITPVSLHVKNLSVGSDFVIPLVGGLLKWLPADRYNDVKTTEHTTVTIKGYSKKRKSDLAKLIESYIGD